MIKVTFILRIVIGALDTVSKGLKKGLEDLEIRGDHENYWIIEIGRNTERSPRDLRRFAVIQNSSERPSADADVKTPPAVNNNNNNNNVFILLYVFTYWTLVVVATYYGPRS